MKINKSIEAFVRGYLFFKVNGKFFYFYNNALEERKRINGNVFFIGFHIFKKYRCFFQRVVFFRQGQPFYSESEKIL